MKKTANCCKLKEDRVNDGERGIPLRRASSLKATWADLGVWHDWMI